MNERTLAKKANYEFSLNRVDSHVRCSMSSVFPLFLSLPELSEGVPLHLLERPEAS